MSLSTLTDYAGKQKHYFPMQGLSSDPDSILRTSPADRTFKIEFKIQQVMVLSQADFNYPNNTRKDM
jgi:hypothetical protein